MMINAEDVSFLNMTYISLTFELFKNFWSYEL